MFLHLGQETLANTRDIIGLFDLDGTTVSGKTREYLARAEKAGQVVNVSFELPKSFVVCGKKHQKNGQAVYISQLSAVTLKNRYDANKNRHKITNKFP